jgi:VanZ family protein
MRRIPKIGDDMTLQRREVVLFRVLLLVLVLVISYLAFTPVHYPVLEEVSDKFKHACAFFALALATDFSFPDRPFDAVKVISLLGYGAGFEIVQHFLPFRSFELLDFVADSVGLAIYALTLPLWRRFPILRGRWLS